MAWISIQLQEITRRLRRIFIIRFIWDVFTRFGNDNGPLLAAGLAFFLVLAFVPMLLTGIAAIGYYFHVTHRAGDAVAEIQSLLTTQILPGAAGNEVKHLMERANIGEKVHHIMATRGSAGIIGVVGIVWASIQVYLSGASVMNAAWEVTEKRNWFKLRLVAFCLLLVSGVLLVLSIVATAYGSWLSHSRIGHIMPGWTIIVNIVTEIGAVTVSSIMYALVYRFLPAANVSWKAAFAGGITAAVMWEIAKKGLAVYLLHPNVSLYGNLANLIIFIIWIYYSMMILLFGAEVAALYAKEVEEHARAELRRTAGITPSVDVSTPSTPVSGHGPRHQTHRRTPKALG